MKLALGLVFLGAIGALLLYESEGSNNSPTWNAVNTDDDGQPLESGSTTEDGIVIDGIKNAAAAAKTALFGTKYDALIANAADANGIPREVLYKLLWVESHFREDIITGEKKSPVGALGIAQFMPATAIQELGSVSAALDPNLAIPGAARYLAKLRDQCGGSIKKAVAAYNWGIGHVLRLGIDNLPPETQQYVAQIVGDNYA